MPDAPELEKVPAAADAEGLSPRGQRKCEQILEGAHEVFKTAGFGGASVDEIARRAGISKATMYRYFPDKMALFNAYVRRECERQAEHLLRIAPDERPLETVLLRLARGYITFILSPFANDMTRHYYAKRMFMGAHALGPIGLMEADPLLIPAEEKLIDQADELVVLVDSTKFDNRSSLVLCPLERIDIVITDDGISDRTASMLEAAEIRLIVAQTGRVKTAGAG